MSTDQERLNEFFFTLKERRKAFAESYALFANKLAPNFNAFKFIRPNEVKLSEILAEFLNPKGDHEQGDIFLRQFFVDLGVDYPSNNEPVSVICEAPTDYIANNLRRLDIKINFGGKFGLAIENKPWACDSEDQLLDYADHLEKKFKDQWHLVYLSGDDSDPSEHSANKTEIAEWGEKYQKINFEFIVDWLKKCEMQCQAEHVRHFLKDFIKYCQHTFLGEVNQVDAELVKKIILEGQHFELAEIIAQQLPEIKNELLMELIEQVKEEQKKRLPECSLSVDSELSYYNSEELGIDFYNPVWGKYKVCLAFDSNYCCLLYYGVVRKDYNEPSEGISAEEQNVIQNLKQVLNKGTTNKWWLWWSYLTENNYDNWKIHATPWQDIQNGKMAKFLIDKVIELGILLAKIIEEAEVAVQKPIYQNNDQLSDETVVPQKTP